MQGPRCMPAHPPAHLPMLVSTLEILQLCPQPWPALTHRNKARLDPWGRASCPTVPGLPSLHPEILM